MFCFIQSSLKSYADQVKQSDTNRSFWRIDSECTPRSTAVGSICQIHLIDRRLISLTTGRCRSSVFKACRRTSNELTAFSEHCWSSPVDLLAKFSNPFPLIKLHLMLHAGSTQTPRSLQLSVQYCRPIIVSSLYTVLAQLRHDKLEETGGASSSPVGTTNIVAVNDHAAYPTKSSYPQATALVPHRHYHLYSDTVNSTWRK